MRRFNMGIAKLAKAIKAYNDALIEHCDDTECAMCPCSDECNAGLIEPISALHPLKWGVFE
jgi:hypothetical protein